MNYVLITVCILLRFVPHPADLSPVFGTLLFSGCRLRGKQSVWFPLAIIVSSDFVLTPVVYHTHIGISQLLTWVAFSIVAMCGWLLREHVTFSRLAACSILAPTAFWIVANFGVWASGTMYARNLSGLVACYIAAVPFYKNALVSTVAVVVLLFAAEEIVNLTPVGRANRLAEPTRSL
jgi:hypothetical protein